MFTILVVENRLKDNKKYTGTIRVVEYSSSDVNHACIILVEYINRGNKI